MASASELDYFRVGVAIETFNIELGKIRVTSLDNTLSAEFGPLPDLSVIVPQRCQQLSILLLQLGIDAVADLKRLGADPKAGISGELNKLIEVVGMHLKGERAANYSLGLFVTRLAFCSGMMAHRVEPIRRLYGDEFKLCRDQIARDLADPSRQASVERTLGASVAAAIRDLAAALDNFVQSPSSLRQVEALAKKVLEVSGLLIRLNFHRSTVAANPGNVEAQKNFLQSSWEVADLLIKIDRSAEALAHLRDCAALADKLCVLADCSDEDRRNYAILFHRFGDILGSFRYWPQAIQAFRRSIAFAEQVASDANNVNRRQSLATTYYRLGLYQSQEGDLAALDSYRTALWIYQELADADPSDRNRQHELADCQDKVGDMLYMSGERRHELGPVLDAIEHYRAGAAIREKLLAADPINAQYRRALAVTYERLGDVFRSIRRPEDALTEYRRSLPLTEALAASDPKNMKWQRDVLLRQIEIGNILADRQPVEAVNTYRRALPFVERLCSEPAGPEARRDASILCVNLGSILSSLGRHTEALEPLQRGLQIRRALCEAQTRNAEYYDDLANASQRLGEALFSLGHNNEAIQAFRDGWIATDAAVASEPNNPDRLRQQSILGFRFGGQLASVGMQGEAREIYLKVAAISERLVNADPSNTQCLIDLATIMQTLAEIGDQSATRTARMLEILERLDAEGKLTPEQKAFLRSFKRAT